MARTAGTKKNKQEPEEIVEKKPGFFDYLRFGESYTSLILGIIVVIIATALLLSFVHNKNAGNRNIPIDQQTQNTAAISQKVTELTNQTPQNIQENVTVSVFPTNTVAPTRVPTMMPTPTKKPQPTAKPTVKPTSKPTIRPTVKPTVKPTVIAKAKPTTKPQPTKKVVVVKPTQAPSTTQNNTTSRIYVVQRGDNLWNIAEKKYTSGYNWVDIARANNLSNPGDIHAGDRLLLPEVKAKITTTNVSKTVNVQNNSTNMNKITGNTYTVVHGDNLWNIAVRAYGDGFRYPDIARANNLSNPRLIHAGNTFVIPR